jgi:hypothetical protein
MKSKILAQIRDFPIVLLLDNCERLLDQGTSRETVAMFQKFINELLEQTHELKVRVIRPLETVWEGGGGGGEWGGIRTIGRMLLVNVCVYSLNFHAIHKCRLVFCTGRW